MSSLLTISAGILLSLALSVTQCLAQTTDSKEEKQVKADTETLTAEQKKLSDYQAQAKWYDQFAEQRLHNANAERLQVERRLASLEEAQPKDAAKNPKNATTQEITALKGWLATEAGTRKQIEITRDRWHSAVEAQKAKMQQTNYQIDVDKAVLDHQKELDKEQSARQAQNPKPAPPQIPQNTVLMPGWETEQGSIPTLLGPNQ